MKKKTKILVTVLIIFLIITGGIINPAVIIVLLAFYGEYRGKKKAKRKFLKEIKKIQLENPYIYFREIPNNYGVGVSGLLLDFNLDQNDLIAAILDLCAKRYIIINEKDDCFEIVHLKDNYNNLLDNEIFILNWILSNQSQELKKFDYQEWRYLVKQDALKLGLTEHRKVDHDAATTIADSITKTEKRIVFLIFIVCFLGISLYTFIGFMNDAGIALSELFSNIGHIFVGLMDTINSMIVGGFISGAILLILWLIVLMFHSFKSSKEYAYNKEMIDTPILTALGNSEIQKLYALGNFIKDFGRFADKHISEIVIWEHYFSYAQLFDLTNYLLNTNYKQLTENECFKIKDTSKIKNIIVKQN